MRTPEQRFWAKVHKSEGCWIWTGARARYGRFWDGNRNVAAHRFSFELAGGTIGEGQVLDHIVCSEPACVRPDHLRAVSQKKNVEHRAHGPLGRNPYRGVYKVRSGRWQARVCHNYRNVSAGTFETPEEAAKAAEALRRRLFDEVQITRLDDEPETIVVEEQPGGDA